MLGGSLVIGVMLVGWIVSAAARDGKTHRNLAIAGRAAGGLTVEELRPVAEQLAKDYLNVAVTLQSNDGNIETSMGALGASVDVDATVVAAIDAGTPAPVVGWMATSFRSYDVNPSITVDIDGLTNTVAKFDDRRTGRAVEPSVVLSGDTLVGFDGQPGQSLEVSDIVAAINKVGYTETALSIPVIRVPKQPRLTVAKAQEAADAANRLTAAPLALRAGAASTEVSPQQQRSWLKAVPTTDGFDVKVDVNIVRRDLEQLLAAGGRAPANAQIVVVGDAPLLTAEVDGLACCDETAAQTVADAVLSPNRAGAIEVPLKVMRPDITADDIRALGIIEPVATFTTKHNCCENRVANIHLAADLIRGIIIKPGETFSINDTLGERTTAKGWLDAPTIKDGKLEPAPGGGLSQFATTIFNTAFFAGLDFGEYQSHSLYIKRYPFAREATANFPAPDLQIKNNSPYGILIWPTYTDKTITVTFYSTKWVASVEQGKQTARAAAKSCTSVTTERIIRFVDGTTKTDSVGARYRAKEGLNCSDPLPPGVNLVAIPGQPPPTPNPQG
jgi:vancomycin resistance protein YoaR